MVKSISVTTFLVVLFFQIASIAQDTSQDLVHAWRIKVNIRLVPLGTTELVTGSVVKTFTYFIKDSLILQRDTIVNPYNRQNIDSVQSKGKNIVSNITVKIAQPVYLIDLARNVTYTFCKDSAISYVAFDSLKNHFDDVFYKSMAQDTFRGKFVVHKVSSDTQDINGYPSYRGYSINKTNDSFPMLLSRRSLPFSAPINAFYPELTETIMSLCVTDPKLPGSQLCFNIEEATKVAVPKNLFEIPPSFMLKKEVPYNKIVRDLIDPFK